MPEPKSVQLPLPFLFLFLFLFPQMLAAFPCLLPRALAISLANFRVSRTLKTT